jgi:hypothetical protein
MSLDRQISLLIDEIDSCTSKRDKLLESLTQNQSSDISMSLREKVLALSDEDATSKITTGTHSPISINSPGKSAESSADEESIRITDRRLQEIFRKDSEGSFQEYPEESITYINKSTKKQTRSRCICS